MSKPEFFPEETPWTQDMEDLLQGIRIEAPSFHLKLFKEGQFGFEFVHLGETFNNSVDDPGWSNVGSKTPYNMLLLGQRTVELVLAKPVPAKTHLR